MGGGWGWWLAREHPETPQTHAPAPPRGGQWWHQGPTKCMIYESMIRVEQAGRKALKWGWARVDHHGTWQSCGSDWAPHPLERAAGHATLTACANARAVAVEPRPLGVPRTFIRRNANTDSRRAGVRWRGECILSRHSKFKFTAVDWVPSAVTGDVKGSRTSTRLHLHTHTRTSRQSHSHNYYPLRR